MATKERKESEQNEIAIDIENLLDLVITELRKGSKVNEKIAEQMIRDTLIENLLMEE